MGRAYSFNDGIAQERARCIAICEGLAIAVQIAGKEHWTSQQREAVRTAALWLRDEIQGRKRI